MAFLNIFKKSRAEAPESQTTADQQSVPSKSGVRLPLRAQIAALLVFFVFAVALISFKSTFNVLEQDKVGAIREIQTLKAADFSRDVADRINKARQELRESALRLLDSERGAVNLNPGVWRWIRVEGRKWVSPQYPEKSILLESDPIVASNEKKLFKVHLHPSESQDLVMVEPLKVVQDAREKILLISAQLNKEELLGDMARMSWGPIRGLVIDGSDFNRQRLNSTADVMQLVWSGKEDGVRDFAQLLLSVSDLRSALEKPTKAISRVFNNVSQSSNVLISWATVPLVGTETNLIALTFANQDAVLAAFWPKKVQLAFFVFVVMGFSLIAAFYLASRMSRPIEEIVSAASVLEKGNFQVRVNDSRRDELGDLAAAFNQMGANLEQREKALEAANIALIQNEKLAALGTLSAGLAHEVKNPLAGILGHADMTSQEIRKIGIPNQEVLLKHIETIQKETKRCRGIIDNLMKFSRNDGSKSSSEFEAMDLELCAWEAIALNEHPLNLAKVKIEKVFAKSIWMMRGNSNQIEQVLLNMMQNAGHAMPKGGVIRIGTEFYENAEQAPLGNLAVINPPDFKGKMVRIFVSDTGEGMPPDVQKRIFEPFFTTKPKGVGTGLGLSVTMQILNDHKARLSLTSAPGQGTTFFIDFPALRERPANILQQLDELHHHRSGGEQLSTDVTASAPKSPAKVESTLKPDVSLKRPPSNRPKSLPSIKQAKLPSLKENVDDGPTPELSSNFGSESEFTVSGVRMAPRMPSIKISEPAESVESSEKSHPVVHTPPASFVVPKPKVKK